MIRIARRLAEIEATLGALAVPAISPELQTWLNKLTNEEALALERICWRRERGEARVTDEALAERIAEAVEARLAGLDVKSIV